MLLEGRFKSFGVLPLSNDKTLATTVQHTPMTSCPEIPPCSLKEMLFTLSHLPASYAITSSMPSNKQPVRSAITWGLDFPF